MSPFDERPSGGVPLDFESWPAPARLLWTTLVLSTAWRSRGWAHVTLRQLASVLALAQRATCCTATVRRWLAWLERRAELERRCVPRGAPLPDGSLAWCDHWIVLPGEAMRTRGDGVSGGGDRTVIPPLHPTVSLAASTRAAENTGERPCACGSRVSDPPLTPVPLKDSRLFSSPGSGSRSSTPVKLRTKRAETEKGQESSATTLAPPVRLLADRLLHHYAESSGATAKHFRARSRAAVAACLEDLEGTDAAKEMRMRAVIADAIAASRARGMAHPPIAFVFNVVHVRRRLERLAEADHLARKAAEAETGDVFAAARAANDERAPERLGATLPATRRGPLAKTGRALRKTPQNAPAAETPPWGASSILTSPGGVYGPEDALRELMALHGEGNGAPAAPSPAASVPLTAEERAELEAAQAAARVRWARAG
jgi:hypothetical protein